MKKEREKEKEENCVSFLGPKVGMFLHGFHAYKMYV